MLLVLLAATGLRLLGLDRSLTVDEAGTVSISSASDFWAAARKDVHPPLYYFLVRQVQTLSLEFTAPRLFSVGCGLGLVALALHCFRKTPTAALVAGGATAALPGFVLFSQQLRQYALLFFLLALALALAAQTCQGAATRRTPFLLSLVLLGAAATHLITVFFLLALCPLLLWPVRTGHLRSWITNLLPLLPAGVLALWLKYHFITPPESLGGGWWISADARVMLAAGRDAFGYSELRWLADAWSRHAPGGSWPVLGGAGLAALFAISTAWSWRQRDPLALILLLSAVVYCATIAAYSCVFKQVFMTRTLLPALLPFLAGLARGIGTHPSAWQRSAATAAVALYVGFTAISPARLALVPEAGLRGLAAAINATCRPGDLLVVFRSMDYSLAAYDCPPAGTVVMFFDQSAAPEPQMAELQRRLGRLQARRRVLAVYRDDYYLQQFRAVFDKAVAEISRHGWKPGPDGWQEADLGLIVAGPAAAP